MRGLQCADPIQAADGIAMAGGNDVVAPLRLLTIHAVSRRNCPDAETVTTPKMIVETTC